MASKTSWSLFCASEQELFQGYMDELNTIGSVSTGERDGEGRMIPAVQYYQRDTSVSYDPLFGEPSRQPGWNGVERSIWRGPFRFPATLEWSDEDGNYDQDVDESGVDRMFRGRMVVSVEAWKVYVEGAHDPGFDAPREGDVVRFFDQGAAYNVNKVMRSGVVLTGPGFVSWTLEVQRRASFDPLRDLPLGSGPEEP